MVLYGVLLDIFTYQGSLWQSYFLQPRRYCTWWCFQLLYICTTVRIRSYLLLMRTQKLLLASHREYTLSVTDFHVTMLTIIPGILFWLLMITLFLLSPSFVCLTWRFEDVPGREQCSMKKGGDGSYLSPGKLASLWGVDEAVFAAGVMRRTVKAGGTNASVALNAAQVKENLLLHLPANCFRFRIYLAYIVVPVFLFVFLSVLFPRFKMCMCVFF